MASSAKWLPVTEEKADREKACHLGISALSLSPHASEEKFILNMIVTIVWCFFIFPTVSKRDLERIAACYSTLRKKEGRAKPVPIGHEWERGRCCLMGNEMWERERHNVVSVLKHKAVCERVWMGGWGGKLLVIIIKYLACLHLRLCLYWP